MAGNLFLFHGKSLFVVAQLEILLAFKLLLHFKSLLCSCWDQVFSGNVPLWFTEPACSGLVQLDWGQKR